MVSWRKKYQNNKTINESNLREEVPPGSTRVAGPCRRRLGRREGREGKAVGGGRGSEGRDWGRHPYGRPRGNGSLCVGVGRGVGGVARGLCANVFEGNLLWQSKMSKIYLLPPNGGQSSYDVLIYFHIIVNRCKNALNCYVLWVWWKT